MKNIIFIIGGLFIICGIGLMFLGNPIHQSVIQNSEYCLSIEQRLDSLVIANDSLKYDFHSYNDRIEEVLRQQKRLLQELDAVKELNKRLP